MKTYEKFQKLCADGEISGACSEAKIQSAEVALGVRFPQQYRDFLSNFGSALFKGGEVYGLPDPISNSPLPLWQDVASVTKQLRLWGQAGSENSKFVPITEDGTGVYFFLDTQESPQTRVVAVGPGIEETVSLDLFEFLVDLSEGNVRLDAI